MTVVELTTEQTFDDFVKSKELTIVHFYAPWAAQCSQINDVFEEMVKLEQYKDVKFAKIDAENVPTVSLEYKVPVIPTVLLFRNNSVIDRVDGVNIIELTKKIKFHLTNKEPALVCAEPKVSLENKLKKLINQAPCMLFMKGSPENPRCGFSRTIVSILDDYKVDYKTFDILEDNEVRQGLKEYIDWPTYPQVYVNGKFVGGLDIVEEIKNMGTMEKTFPIKDCAESKVNN